MSVNFARFGNELKSAYEDVISDSSDTNWALFGYDKQTNDLKVIETGDGGIEELGEEFSGSKIQYGWCKVTDPNTNLPKLVLINWFGEAAPTSRKGVCQRHVNDIAGFLRGAHVTINARHEGDVEEKVVLEKVSKSSGARYGFHKEKARPVEPSGPVGSVYKKADVRADIDANKRDQFWSDQEKLEKKRVQEERKVKIEEAKKRDSEIKEREARERQLRGEREAERARAIDAQKAREREDYRRREEEDRAHYKARMEQLDAETEREKRQAHEERRRFKQQERETIGAAVRHTKETVAEREAATRQAEEEAADAQRAVEEARRAVEEARAMRDAEAQAEAEAEAAAAEEAARQAQEAAEQALAEQREAEEAARIEAEEAARIEAEEAERIEAEEIAQREAEEAANQENVGYAEVEESAADEDMYGNAAVEEHQAQSQADDAMYGNLETTGVAPAQEQAVDEHKSLQAVAVYDYQAADDSEISFDPGDLITDIDQVDEGWWTGRAPDNSYGMFPANYVELC